jgi:predicted small secreted protein
MLEMRPSLVVVAVCAVSVTLVACERVGGLGRVAIQADGGDLRVAVCEEIDATAITMSARQNRFGMWAKFWSDTSGAHIDAGAILSTADPALSASETKTAPRLASGSEVTVTLIRKGPGDNIAGDFVIPTEGLPTVEWLKPDGSISQAPCADD